MIRAGVASKEWRKNATLLLLSVGFSILLAEMLAAIFVPQNLGTWGMTRDGLTTHVPNVSVYLHEFGQKIEINSHGMRDREHELTKPPDTLRILVLGDSFMEANQVAFQDSFVNVLEGELRARIPRQIEVINASVSGWGTDDELTYLQRYGYRFEPDVILIAMTLHNDIQDNLQEEFHSFEGGELRARPIQDIPVFEYATLQMKEFLASHSHLYQILLRGLRSSWMRGEGRRLNAHVASLIIAEENPEINRGWDMTHRLFHEITRESEKLGAKTMVFMIPLWVQVSEHRLKEFLLDVGLSRSQVQLQQPQYKMKQIAASEHIALIDLLPEFERWEEKHPGTLYLEKDGHWTSQGHRLAAEKVAETLLKTDFLQNETREAA